MEEEKTSKKLFALEWIVRTPENGRQFRQVLIDIHDNFKYTCNIGSDEYWQKFMNNHRITRILKLTTLNNGVWSGFVAIKDGFQCFPAPDRPGYGMCTYKNQSWYVELICADNSDDLPGRGSEMMQEVIRSAVEHEQKYLCLSALPYVIMWYYRQGFRLTMDTSCVQSAKLHDLAEDIRRRKKRFANDDEAFADPEFVNFLRVAVAQGLGANRLLYNGKQQSPCEADDGSEKCAQDGVYMMICLSDKSFEFQSEVSIVYQDENEAALTKKKSELDWFVQLSKTQKIPESEFNLKTLEDWPIIKRDD